MESLGYVASSGVSEQFDFDQSKDDPKDWIDSHTAIIGITTSIARKQYKEAYDFCKTLLAQRPGYMKAHHALATIAMKQHVHAAAIPHLREAERLSPDDPMVLNAFSIAFFNL